MRCTKLSAQARQGGISSHGDPAAMAATIGLPRVTKAEAVMIEFDPKLRVTREGTEST